MGDRTKLCDYTNTPNDQFIARPIATPEIKADSYEVSPQAQFYSSSSRQNDNK